MQIRFGNYSSTTNPTPTPTPAPSGTCQVTYTIQNQWPGGFTGNVILANTGTSTMNGWTLQFAFAAGQQIQSAWNTSISQQGFQVTAKDLSYNAVIAPGGSTFFGFNASWNNSNPVPSAFTLNGSVCSGEHAEALP